MEVSRESLVQNLTVLKSLLRLNADGIGDSEDLATQLSRARLALDRFEGDFLGNQHIIREDVITPDTLPPSSCASDEDLDRDGLAYFSRPTTASSMTSQRFSLDSLSKTWQSSPNSFPFVSPRDSLAKKFGLVEDVKEVQEEEGEGEEGEEGQGDVAFQRLSMLLAGLQAQAEAAVGSPTGSLRRFNTLGSSAEVEEEEEMAISGMSRSTSSSVTTITNNAMSVNASCPGTPQLTTSFHKPSNSLPFIAPGPPRSSRIVTDKDGDSFNILPSPRMQLSPIRPESTVPQPPTMEVSSTPPTLRKRPVGLDLSPPKSGVSSTIPSPAPLSRRASYLVTDTELETLLSDLLEQTQIRSLEGAYDVMFTWVWAYLLGGGMVWTVVGWVLGWGCRECNCAAAS